MRRGKQWIGFLVMVLGAALLLGPFVLGDLETRRQNDYVAELQAQMSQTTAPAVQTAGDTPAAVQTPTGAFAAAATPGMPDASMLPDTSVSIPDGQGAATAAPVDGGGNTLDTQAPATAISAETPAAATTGTIPSQATVSPVPTVTAEPQDPFFQEALAYNRKLVAQGQNGMNTIDDLQTFEVNAQKYGYKDNVVGTISIPRLSVEVPLYLGATREHMASGFAVFGMTSIPLGLGEENVAIAGHRGWRGAAMLRDVQMLMMGDPIHITTPWASLTYIVSGIEIVTPTNANWCKLKPGKTMISLMTCHPYGQHSQRYIVYAELQKDEGKALAPVIPSAEGAIEAGMLRVTGRLNRAAMPTSAPSAAAPAAASVAVSSPEPTSAAPDATSNAAKTSANVAYPGQPRAINQWGRTKPEPTQTSNTQEITFIHDDGTRETILIDTTAVNPDDREFSTEWSNTLILAENNMRPVAFITAGIVALVGLWLTAVTILDAKKNKRGKHDDEE